MTCGELMAEVVKARGIGLPAFVLQVRRKRYPSNRIRIARALPATIIGGNKVGYFVSVDVEEATRFCLKREPEVKIPARVQAPLEKFSPDLRRQLGYPEPASDPWEGVPL